MILLLKAYYIGPDLDLLELKFEIDSKPELISISISIEDFWKHLLSQEKLNPFKEEECLGRVKLLMGTDLLYWETHYPLSHKWSVLQEFIEKNLKAVAEKAMTV